MEEKEVALQGYLEVISRRKWIIIGIFLIVTTLGLGAGIIKQRSGPKIYIASTTVAIVEPISSRAIFKDMGPSIGTSFRQLSSIATQCKIITSRSVAEEVVKAMQIVVAEASKVKGKSEEWSDFQAAVRKVQKSILVLPVEGTNLIRINVQADDPQKAMELANILARVFVDQSVKAKRKEMQEAYEFVEKRLEVIKNNLEEAERNLWQYKAHSGFASMGPESGRFASLENSYVESKIEREMARVRLESIRKQIRKEKEGIIPSISNIRDFLVERLRTKVAELEFERSLLLREYTEKHPEVEDMTTEIEETIEALKRAVARGFENELPGRDSWTNYQTLVKEALDLEIKINALEVRQNAYNSILEQYRSQFPIMADKKIELARLQRAVDSNWSSYQAFLQKREDIYLAMAMETGEVRIIDPAIRPISSVRSIKIQAILIEGVMGLILGFGIVFFLEYIDTSIKSSEDVERYLNLKVIGTIPQMIRHHSELFFPLITHRNPKSPMSEAYRTLRTNIQFATVNKVIKTLMIVSAVPGEGKSTVTANLAVTLADIGMKTLLVDTDLRRPAVHKIFQLDRSPGLTSILTEDLSYQRVVKSTEIENLSLITCGELPLNPSELLGSEKMKNLLEELKTTFDIILFDIPSTLVVTDAAVLSSEIDALFLIIHVGKGRRETILQAKNLLNNVGTNILGAILNFVKVEKRRYYYYYYYEEKTGERKRKKWHHA